MLHSSNGNTSVSDRHVCNLTTHKIRLSRSSAEPSTAKSTRREHYECILRHILDSIARLVLVTLIIDHNINANLLKEEILALRDKGSTIIFSTHNMSSVEEICDHITLINKSRNILSGEVDEIRRRHGSNIFEVAYRGEEQTLRQAVAGRCEILDGTQEESVYRTLKLHVESDADVRGVISAVNDAVELRSFREIIPSMNDIFIRAVNGSL